MPLTVCCLNAANYLGRGADYVAKLHAGVSRHLTIPHRFVCFTDATDVDGVEVRPLPQDGLKGWYNKLALFKPGTFEPGERVLFLDLDTLITGSLDEIASYAGSFALLDDLMFPGQWGSGVMAWRAGAMDAVWNAFVDRGFPDVPGGDQAFIMQAIDRADLFQDLYPNQIASYKMSYGVLSPHTRVVCFHGRPRPHEVEAGWVPNLWTAEKAA